MRRMTVERLMIVVGAVAVAGAAHAQAPAAGDKAQLAVLGGPKLALPRMFTNLELLEPGASAGTWTITARDRVLLSGASNRTQGSVHFVLRNDSHFGILSYETVASGQFDVDAMVRLGTKLVTGKKSWTIKADDEPLGFGVFGDVFGLVIRDSTRLAVIRPNGRGGLRLMDVIEIVAPDDPGPSLRFIAVAAHADPNGPLISITDVASTDFVRWNGSALVLTTVPRDTIRGVRMPGWSATFRALAGDVDGNGFDDIVLSTADPGSTTMAVVSVDPTQAQLFTEQALTVPISATATKPWGAGGTELFNGDLVVALGKLLPGGVGRLDLVTRNRSDGRLRVFEIDVTTGTPTLSARLEVTAGKPVSGHIYAGATEEFLGTVDLTADGQDELLLRNSESVVAVHLTNVLGKLGFLPFEPVAHEVMGCCTGASRLTLRGGEDVVPYFNGKRSLVLVTRTQLTPPVPPPRLFTEAELWNRANVKNVVRFDRATKGAYAKRNGQLDAARVADWQAERGLYASGRADDATITAAEKAKAKAQ
jgi:hypothetical protein